MPILPAFGDLNVSTPVVLVFVTSRAAWISSFIVTTTPLPTLSLLIATFTALNKFNGPSALSEPLFLIAPTMTTGLSLLTTRSRKYAVSSIVSVPCVMTIPSALPLFSSSFTRLASFSQTSLFISCEPMFEICSPFIVAILFISGTAAMSLSTVTVPEV